MLVHRIAKLGLVVLLSVGPAIAPADEPPQTAPDAPAPRKVRIAAAQPKSRLIDYQLAPDEALARVDESLADLERLVHDAGQAGCDAVALPEDTLGLGHWEAGNKAILDEVLPAAVDRMLERLGRAAASHRMYLVCSSDTIDAEGLVRNTAFLLGRDGAELGRYDKVNMPIHELDKQRGTGFPVFDTPDLGSVGMLICYDMVFPEAPRCLALAGADVIFHPTLGGAAIGDAELSLAAFRTRAVENFVYIVVAQRGSGSMIISPQGKVLAEAEGQDSLAIADIDPRGGREGGDALNHQADMRARLFRERSPEAFGILTEREPPILRKAPETIGIADAVRIGAGTLTAGEDRFKAAEALARAGKRDEAVRAFEQLRRDFPHTWIDRVSRERLAQTARLRLRPGQRQTDAQSEKNPAKAETPDARLPEGRTGIAARYQGDEGIERDPAIIFVERFDEGAVEDLAKRWESVQGAETMSLSDDVPEQSTDRRSLLITHVGGQGNGGQLYRRLPPGHEQVYARFYVKFDQDCAAIHHFGTHLGGFNPPTPWPQGGAGTRPSGKGRFTTGVEPNGADWSWDFYTYWQGMHVHGDGRYWGTPFQAGTAKPKVEHDRWICVEMMVKMNDPRGESNGEQAFWIDGKLWRPDGQVVSHVGQGFPRGRWSGGWWAPDSKSAETFEGFRWSSTKDLAVNYVWAYLYITKAPRGHVSKVWFDNIVVSREYIGPIEPE